MSKRKTIVHMHLFSIMYINTDLRLICVDLLKSLDKTGGVSETLRRVVN